MLFRQSKNKYHNKKVLIDGIEFDSMLEARRWLFLKQLQKNGNISDLQRQVSFTLIPAQYETIQQIGKRGQPLKPKQRLVEHAVTYKADFTYMLHDSLVVEDTKGLIMPEYVIKRKLMRLQGNPIVQVKKPYQAIAGL